MEMYLWVSGFAAGVGVTSVMMKYWPCAVMCAFMCGFHLWRGLTLES